jgi:hypothetical protein
MSYPNSFGSIESEQGSQFLLLALLLENPLPALSSRTRKKIGAP